MSPLDHAVVTRSKGQRLDARCLEKKNRVQKESQDLLRPNRCHCNRSSTAPCRRFLLPHLARLCHSASYFRLLPAPLELSSPSDPRLLTHVFDELLIFIVLFAPLKDETAPPSRPSPLLPARANHPDASAPHRDILEPLPGPSLLISEAVPDPEASNNRCTPIRFLLTLGIGLLPFCGLANKQPPLMSTALSGPGHGCSHPPCPLDPEDLTARLLPLLDRPPRPLDRHYRPRGSFARAPPAAYLHQTAIEAAVEAASNLASYSPASFYFPCSGSRTGRRRQHVPHCAASQFIRTTTADRLVDKRANHNFARGRTRSRSTDRSLRPNMPIALAMKAPPSATGCGRRSLGGISHHHSPDSAHELEADRETHPPRCHDLLSTAQKRPKQPLLATQGCYRDRAMTQLLLESAMCLDEAHVSEGGENGGLIDPHHRRPDWTQSDETRAQSTPSPVSPPPRWQPSTGCALKHRPQNFIKHGGNERPRALPIAKAESCKSSQRSVHSSRFRNLFRR